MRGAYNRSLYDFCYLIYDFSLYELLVCQIEIITYKFTITKLARSKFIVNEYTGMHHTG